MRESLNVVSGRRALVYFGSTRAQGTRSGQYRRGSELAAVNGLINKSPASLQTRVGIATGLVDGGDLIGSGRSTGARHPRGDAEGRGRLRASPSQNTILNADGTQRLPGNLTERGSPGPARGWTALRASSQRREPPSTLGDRSESVARGSAFGVVERACARRKYAPRIEPPPIWADT
jgi:hypothetical protein